MLFQGRRRKWKNGPHSYVTHPHQSPAPVQPAARLIMSYCVSARRERAAPAQLPAGPLASPPLRWRVENTLTWRPPYFPSVWEERGEKKTIWCGVSEASGANGENSGAEALCYCGSGKADGVSVATRRGQPEDGRRGGRSHISPPSSALLRRYWTAEHPSYVISSIHPFNHPSSIPFNIPFSSTRSCGGGGGERGGSAGDDPKCHGAGQVVSSSQETDDRWLSHTLVRTI